MKKFLNIIGVSLVIIIGIGFYIKTFPSIPDNAQIDVFPSYQYWIPHAPFAAEIMERQLEDPEKTELIVGMLSEITPTTWIEKKNGKYKDYTLPPGWKTYHESYTTGESQSLIMSIFFNKKGRWNEDGSWNY
ncbi:MAG: hypothetical protein KDE26_18190 [Bacteroidetes bacterium]|nr:hypothetical protein [Bacteroidota bacterium]